ncbi:MAG: marine proteobacterial sortase target protein [Pseudomonadota bacterium]
MQYWIQKRKNEHHTRVGWCRLKATRERFRRALLAASAPLFVITTVGLLATAPNVVAETMRPEQAGTGTLLLALPTQSAASFRVAPRLSTGIDLKVVGDIARATVTQTFLNPTDDWVEATYVFPLPADAAVDHMELLIGERRIVGEIHEKAEAKRIYKAAKRAGKRSALLSQERPNLFTTAVANIAPREQVRVAIEYQQRVRRQGDRYSLRIPTTLTRRFVPGTPVAAMPDKRGSGWSPATDEVEDAARVTPPSVSSALVGDSHRLQFRARIDIGSALMLLDSRYHPIDVTPGPDTRYTVTLAHRDELLDHDLELNWERVPEATVSTTSFADSGADGNFVLARVMPPMTIDSAQRVPRSLILVIDTSGSMQGVSIEQARSAAIYAINQLGPDDQFNLIEFNDQATALFDRAVDATPANLQAAQQWLSRLQANGGTNMAPALNMALRGDVSGRLQQVLFVTDGAVGNEEALFTQISRDLGQSRLFTVGIGSAPNGWFMRKAAELGRGTQTTISAIGEVETRMIALFSQLTQPVLTDISLDWDGADVEQYPAIVSDLYVGQPLDVTARLEADHRPSTVTIKGRYWRKGTPEPWQQQVTVDWTNPAGPGIGIAWARDKIESLGDQRRRGGNPTLIRDAIAAVALRHHIVSEATSLVAVDKTPARTAADLLKRRNVANVDPYGTPAQPLGALVPTATDAVAQRWLGALMILGSLLLLLISRLRGMRHVYL